jgi:hypothetical protein
MTASIAQNIDLSCILKFFVYTVITADLQLGRCVFPTASAVT